MKYEDEPVKEAPNSQRQNLNKPENQTFIPIP